MGLSIVTIRHYDEVGLVVPSARSQGGFRLYTDTDIDRLILIRRMKPLGFTLEQMSDLLSIYDELSGRAHTATGARKELLARLVDYREDAVKRGTKLRQQVEYAEDFIAMLTDRIIDLDGNARQPNPPA
ncbi:MerR family transcriptional regulator [Actinomycetes bacterium KLBMP 9797]